MLTLARDSAHVYVGYSFQVNNDDNVLLDVFSHGGQYQRRPANYAGDYTVYKFVRKHRWIVYSTQTIIRPVRPSASCHFCHVCRDMTLPRPKYVNIRSGFS